MNSFLLISATHRHFDKLVTNTKHIELVANTKYIGGKYKVWGEKEQGECQVVRPGNQRQNQRSTPISSDARHYATLNYGKQRQKLCHYGKQCTVVDNWERCTVDERTTVIQFRRRGARRVSGAYRCTCVTCIWAIYPACTSRAVSGCYRNVAKAQCRVRQWSCHSGRPQAISICHRSCQRTISFVLVWWLWH